MTRTHPSSTPSRAPSTDTAAGPPLELWGGCECTVNRVGDAWHDQTLLSGHEQRRSDLALFAALGIRSLRYPALWERIAPDHPQVRDFAWTDERLAEIRRLDMNPIVTLCHHGSGPRYTDLLDEGFAPGLAAHAAAVAARYPWVTDWTPVNEPLTTARFSALYGYWYPHTTDEGLFWRALLNEIDATRLAMRAIRAVNPVARLVQTDDLGFCHATPPLQCEADFQNQRRWMGWDLLCGRVVSGHPLWERLLAFGLEPRLRAIAADPCRPDIIGINHYLSSERLLDHRVELHPHRSVADKELGSCAGIPHVDVDAIRSRPAGVLGLGTLLRQAWDRYGIPLAVTECHNGATREEQARWFVEAWQGALALREQGVELRAVAAWALLGSHDWNRMVTRFCGHYEPGVFDVRGGRPRPTRMASVLRALADGRTPEAPGLEVPGWWRRATRLLPHPVQGPCFELAPQEAGGAAALLVVGDDGPLTHLAIRACEARGLRYVRLQGELAAALEALSPWAVLDTRDREGLSGARRRPPDAHGARSSVARVCANAGVPCALFTSAFGPGLAAEALALPGLLVARTGPVFTPWDDSAVPVRWLDALDGGNPAVVDAHRRWHCVYGPDLLDGVLDLLLDGAAGGFSFVPREHCGATRVALQLARLVDRGPADLQVCGDPAPAELPEPDIQHAPSMLPPLETTLERFVRERRLARSAGEAAVGARRDDVRSQEVG